MELGKEYRAIHEAGIILQVDVRSCPTSLSELDLTKEQMKRRAEIYVEAVNEALKGIPAERVRFHTCYGVNHGPRIYEADLCDIIHYVLKINAGSYSFENGNARHEHEYHLFEKIKVSEGKVLCPGVITHSSNIVEHPELIAERLLRFARLVGRENVMAGADCGFASQAALYRTEVHETVVWEKFKALRKGADIASKQLWRTNERSGRETMRWLKASLCGAAVGAALAMPVNAADKITLGFMTSLSGTQAILGVEIRDGMQLALDQLGGKIGGLPAKVIIEDDQNKADVARQLADKFVRSDKVDAAIGFLASNVMLSIYRPLVDAKMITISSNPGPSQIAGKDCSPYFFDLMAGRQLGRSHGRLSTEEGRPEHLSHRAELRGRQGRDDRLQALLQGHDRGRDLHATDAARFLRGAVADQGDDPPSSFIRAVSASSSSSSIRRRG